MMVDCIFCKIVNRKIPGLIVYEDEYTMVFMDIAKDVDGHMVAIPKKHVKNIYDCDIETISRLMLSIKKVSEHLVGECGYQGVNLLNASGECAGQSVSHFHIHIIPRKLNDGINAWTNFKGAKYEIEQIYSKIKIGF